MFLVRSVNLVASDRVDKAGHTNFEIHRWACGVSGGSGGPRSLRSVEVPTPTPPTPLLSSECPSSNSTLRGQTTQRSVSRKDESETNCVKLAMYRIETVFQCC